MITPPVLRSKYNPLDIRFYHNVHWFLRFRLERWFHRICPRRWNPIYQAQAMVRRESRQQVMAGPFRGMPYVSASIGSVYEAKLLGTYELELHEWIERLCARKYKRIVVVGAAEGYFVAGFARRLPEALITAFDPSPEAQRLLRELTSLNHVAERVTMRGFCTPEELARTVRDERPCLVFMDVDGGEYELLDPDTVPELRTCDILVELHECFRVRMDQTIEDRFRPTHRIERIRQRGRSLKDIPFRPRANALLLKMGLRRLLNEQRGYPQTWFLMQAQAEPVNIGRETRP